MSTVTAPTPMFVRDLPERAVVDAAGIIGTVLDRKPVRGSKNVELVLDVGGQPCGLRITPDRAVTVLPALPEGQARDADHRPNYDGSTGTSCSCGWAPAKRPARMSMWNVAYNRHRKSLHLLPL